MSNRIALGMTDRILQYLKEEDIENELPEIAELLTREADRRQIITVMSAAELTKKEEHDLHATLTEKWGEHPIAFTVDASLLSGMIIAFQNQVIDMSGRAAIADLRQTLA